MSLVAVPRRTITLRLIPYDTTSRNTALAVAQVIMSTPNFHRLRIVYPELPHDNAALTPARDVRNGFCHVSEAPRHGHELKPRLHSRGTRQIPD